MTQIQCFFRLAFLALSFHVPFRIATAQGQGQKSNPILPAAAPRGVSSSGGGNLPQEPVPNWAHSNKIRQNTFGKAAETAGVGSTEIDLVFLDLADAVIETLRRWESEGYVFPHYLPARVTYINGRPNPNYEYFEDKGVSLNSTLLPEAPTNLVPLVSVLPESVLSEGKILPLISLEGLEALIDYLKTHRNERIQISGELTRKGQEVLALNNPEVGILYLNHSYFQKLLEDQPLNHLSFEKKVRFEAFVYHELLSLLGIETSSYTLTSSTYFRKKFWDNESALIDDHWKKKQDKALQEFADKMNSPSLSLIEGLNSIKIELEKYDQKLAQRQEGIRKRIEALEKGTEAEKKTPSATDRQKQYRRYRSQKLIESYETEIKQVENKTHPDLNHLSQDELIKNLKRLIEDELSSL